MGTPKTFAVQRRSQSKTYTPSSKALLIWFPRQAVDVHGMIWQHIRGVFSPNERYQFNIKDPIFRRQSHRGSRQVRCQMGLLSVISCLPCQPLFPTMNSHCWEATFII
ncbi:hypothetical protein AVEN_45581-1 [Araneus ventricosus]|uniref:Uncharacterized protein n=1 Tax=Araneus ventricosus TaxID=182803 RepID=A0A4Y2UMF5_ARAVE|nr:hypothetical protein AVEN_45581-1 [Araneus ventricosus]